jgi:hypothetical protein
MIRSTISATAAVLAGSLISSAAQGQTRQEPASPIIRSETRLVDVEVVVRDKDGPVSGLKKEDFTLLDQGKKQTIAVFSGGSFGGASPTGEPSRGTAISKSRHAAGFRRQTRYLGASRAGVGSAGSFRPNPEYRERGRHGPRDAMRRDLPGDPQANYIAGYCEDRPEPVEHSGPQELDLGFRYACRGRIWNSGDHAGGGAGSDWRVRGLRHGSVRTEVNLWYVRKSLAF